MRASVLVPKGRRIPAKAAPMQVAVAKTLPAPIGGWNVRDPQAAMDPRDALKLENWFPEIGYCEIRMGAANHLTGMASLTKTLVKHTPPNSANNKLYACSNDGVFDATSAGAVGAAVAACTDGYFNWTQMGVSGGHYMMLFNGVDKPIYFDGTTWTAVDAASTPALTGVTTTDLIAAGVYKRRLFILEKNKLNFWYLAADAVGGALTQFLLGPIAQRGGYTVAVMNWSFDGGDGPDDHIVFITSEGEAIVYTGTDPGSASAWSLVGVYFVGKPIGRKPFTKMGGDLAVITEFGVLPLSKALQSATVDYRFALSNKVEGAFRLAARTYGSIAGWQALTFPLRGMLICNIAKVAGSSYEQYVMNTTTKAWCKFTGWNAASMLEFNGDLYLGLSNKVGKAFSGRSDFGSNIVADAQTAFSYMGTKQQKQWGLFRPMLAVNGSISFNVGLAVDFDTTPALSEATYSVTSGAVWDVSKWDESYWAAGLEVVKDWRTPAADVGVYGAGLVKVTTSALQVQWMASEYSYTKGALVG